MIQNALSSSNKNTKSVKKSEGEAGSVGLKSSNY